MSATVETVRPPSTPNLDLVLKAVFSEQRIFDAQMMWESKGRTHPFRSRELTDDRDRVYTEEFDYRERDYCGTGNRILRAKFTKKWKNGTFSYAHEVSLDLKDENNPQISRTEIQLDSENGVETTRTFFGEHHIEESAKVAVDIINAYQELSYKQRVS